MASRNVFLATLPVLAAATAAPLRAQTPRLRIGVSTTEGGMEPYYAKEIGAFDRVGLDVEMTPITSGANGITAVVAGSFDISASTVPLIANAVLRGIPLQYMAGAALWSNAAPYAGVIVAKDSPIRTARDFEGKVVGVNGLRDGTHLIMLAYLTKNGADVSKVSFIETHFSTMPQAVATGRIAGALSAEPFMPGPTDDTKVLAMGYDALGDHFLALGFYSTADWIKANVATARKFRTAIYETARWANDKANKARTSEIFEKYSKTPAATIARMVRATFAEKLDPSMVDPWLDWSFRMKFIERRLRGSELVATL
jgi:NitT/TauT family transport system substrate-binding protein